MELSQMRQANFYRRRRRGEASEVLLLGISTVLFTDFFTYSFLNHSPILLEVIGLNCLGLI